MNIPQPTAGNRGTLWMGLQWIQGRWGKGFNRAEAIWLVKTVIRRLTNLQK